MEPQPKVGLVPVARGRRWDRLGLALALTALVMALVKPWPSGSQTTPRASPNLALGVAASVLPEPDRPVGVAADPSPDPDQPIVLPAVRLDPSPAQCYEETGWQICVLAEAPTERLIRSQFNHTPGPAAAPTTPTAPALVVIGPAGAALGFFAPLTGDKSMPGRIFVTGWRVDEETEGTAAMALRAVPAGMPGQNGSAGPSVFLASSPAFASTRGWPVGAYMFLLQSADGTGRAEYFPLEVLPAELPTTRDGPAWWPHLSDSGCVPG